MYETKTKNKVFVNVNNVLFNASQLEDIDVRDYHDGVEESCVMITYLSGRTKMLVAGTKKQCNGLKRKVMNLL